MKNDDIVWSRDGDTVTAGAGVSWDRLVEESVKRDRFGLENLSGIPGSVGGAAGGNIGAYGSEVGETLLFVEVLDTRDMSFARLSSEECRLEYRDSLFKHEEGKRLIILRAAFSVKGNGELDRAYKDIAEYEKQHGEIVSLSDMRSAILSIRGKKFPADGNVGTAGSFFKNPVVGREAASEFLARFPDAPNFPQADGTVKLSAAWIIDKVLNMRGVHDGAVGTWPLQALVLVNYGGAKASELVRFAQMIIERAKNETGVVLTPEVIYVDTEATK
jgi:UDP-N-acetylmuramate dehydrogenase